jgi:hypothetical protein
MNKKIKTAVTIAVIIIIAGIVSGAIFFVSLDKSQNNIKEKMQGSKILVSGDFGPYNYDKTNGAFVAISNKISAITYYEGEKGYVIVNNKKFGPYDGMTINSLKVSNNFWGVTTYSQIPVGGSVVKDSEKAVVINGNKIKLGNNTDNVEFSFSDGKNSWGIQYDDMASGRRKFIINNAPSTETEYTGLNRIAAYQKDNGDYYVKVDGNEYLIGSIDDEGALFSQCMIYDNNKWGCSVGKKEGTWHIFVYENGIKKEYGPYGKFSDPREMSEFKLSNDGFIFCSSNLAVVNKNGSEKIFHGQDIYQCNYAEGNFGFIHASDKNNGLVNVNGKEYGPYALIDNFSLTDGGWGFSGYISKKDKSEYIVNGITISDINSITGPAISNDYWAVGYEKDGKLYMRVEKNKK